MSIACDSPPNNQNDSYFSPRVATYSSQSSDDNDDSPSSGQTPFFTAPISPANINPDFMSAIQNRNTFSNLRPPNSLPATLQSDPNHTYQRSPVNAISLSLSNSISNRRKGSLSGAPSSSSATFSAAPSKLSVYTPDTVAFLLSESARTNPEPSMPSTDPLKARHQKFTLPLLLLDVRSLRQFSESHIRTAINVCIPTMILKRPTFNIGKMIDTLLIDDVKKKFSQWEEYANIVLYDDSNENMSDIIGFVAQKFLVEGYPGGLGWLRGGINAFIASHPDLISVHHRSPTSPHPPALSNDNGLPTAQPNNTAALARRAQLTFGPFTAPVSPRFENQAFNPFFTNIRQNMELTKDGISERFPVRLPAGISIEGNNVIGGRLSLTRYPRWLLDVVRPGGEGEKRLAKMYEHLEKAEQQRLQSIMAQSSRSSTEATEHPLSICAGLEKGTLNRYTNTWPYEYTRVKLSECSLDQTDYINASYIDYSPVGSASALSSRRYIATQGPLPTTFTDFWKMVWEHRSQIIVMLTKEEEMNRVKCHCYWPTQVNSPCDFNPITVSLLRQTTHSLKTEPGDIIIRVFSLTHRLKPDHPPFEVTHIQYTGWMDFGVPDDPRAILKVIDVADEERRKYEMAATDEQQSSIEGEKKIGPMVVHCSAGCGRSGSFCTLDTVLGLIQDGNINSNDDDYDPLFAVVERFREQRVSMVQTLRQFVFCYEAVWWATLGFKDS